MSKREFNPKAFFRKLDPKIRDRLFQQLGLPAVEFSGKRSKALDGEKGYEAWSRAAPAVRQVADRELMRINDLSSDAARYYLNEVAQRTWHGAIGELARAQAWPNADLAAFLYMDSRAEFDAVHAEFSVDDISFRVVRVGREFRRLEPTAARKAELAARIAGFFRDAHEGIRQVRVEDHGDGSRLALFIYHQDRCRYEDAFEGGGRLIALPRLPVLQAMAVYHSGRGLLTVKSRLSKLRERLPEMIGRIYFDDAEFFAAEYQREFDFSPLGDPCFDFPFRSGDGIGGACAVEVSFHHPDPSVGLVIAQCIDGRYRDAVRGLNADPARVHFSGVKIEVKPDGRAHKRRRTIALQAPNRWNLNETPRDLQLGGLLDTWGFIRKANAHERGYAEEFVDASEPAEQGLVARVAARYGGTHSPLAA